jgi:hypothetical protein
LAENERDLVGLRAEKRLPVYLSVDADALTATTFSYGVAVGEHAPQVFGVDSAKDEALAFFRFCEGIARVKAKSQGHFAVFHFGGAAVHRLSRLAEKYQEADMVAVVPDLLKHMVDLRAILQRSFFFPAPLDSAGDALRMLSPELLAGKRPLNSLATLTVALQEVGDDPPAIDAGMEELRAAAERIGVPADSLVLEDDDLSVVWFRMFLERKHAIWQKLIERKQAERLQALRHLTGWVMSYAPEADGGKEKAGNRV